MKVALVLAAVLLGPAGAYAETVLGRVPVTIQIRVRTDAGRFQLGAGATSGTRPSGDVFVGYHLTDRWIVRARERIAADVTELEMGYAVGVGKVALPTASIVHFKAFVLAGGGVTRDREATAFAGGMLQTYVTDHLTVELGARGAYVPVAPAWAARTLEPLAAGREVAVEAFVGVSLVLGSTGYTCRYR